MANPKGNWKPGQSGNPAGRPPKGRALTAILEQAGGKTVEVKGPDGTTKRVTGKKLLAELVWQVATTGSVTLPNGETKKVEDFDDWFAAVKFIYQHIDGPPKAELGVSADDGSVTFSLSFGTHASRDD